MTEISCEVDQPVASLCTPSCVHVLYVVSFVFDSEGGPRWELGTGMRVKEIHNYDVKKV